VSRIACAKPRTYSDSIKQTDENVRKYFFFFLFFFFFFLLPVPLWLFFDRAQFIAKFIFRLIARALGKSRPVNERQLFPFSSPFPLLKELKVRNFYEEVRRGEADK